jgi:hypothetical protein
MRRWKLFTAMPFLFVPLLFACLGQTEGAAERIAGNTAQAQARPSERADGSVPITLPVGTTISVRIADVVNSNHNHTGDLITGIVDPSVFIADHVVIPRGTEAHVRLVLNRKGGRLHGKADVRLELVSLVLNKEKLDVDSDEYRKKQSAIDSKLKGTGKASANAGASAATSPNPAGGAVGPVIAIFRAAKVELQAGTRIPFALESPFSFDGPVEESTQR